MAPNDGVHNAPRPAHAHSGVPAAQGGTPVPAGVGRPATWACIRRRRRWGLGAGGRRNVGEGTRQVGMHWKGGGGGGLQGAQPMPSHCPPDAKCQPQWHL